MTWFKQKSFIFAMILLIFISIIINFFFSNSVTHIIVTVFLGIETLWIISIFNVCLYCCICRYILNLNYEKI
ncbi:hypothetical protein EP04_11900 [Listeria monocytogenes]|nr:hypothetical protein [Listeria monocytogenes]EAE1300215.1 hypothetical protein [Listeria monocytogenes]